KRKVKKLKRRKKSKTHGLRRLYKVGLFARVESSPKEQSLGEEDASKQGRNIDDIDADAEITLVDETGRFDDQEMFDTGVLDDEEVVVVKKEVADKEVSAVKEVDVTQDQVSAATTTTAKELNVDDITLAKALEAFKTLMPKIRGIVVRDHKELSESTTIPTSIDQESRRLQAELDQEQRLAKEKAQKALEANIVMIEQWHDVQTKIEADFELAQRLHQEEQELLTDDEKAELFMEFLEKKESSLLLRELKRGKAQQRSLMCTYLKNMDGCKPKSLKSKSFAEIQELFDKEMTRINNFIDFKTELVEESSKKVVQKEKEKRLNKKALKSIRLQVDYEVEMEFDLLRLVRRQLREGYVPK
nr:hypothetical protein [Tanacetum cinerariifolium]